VSSQEEPPPGNREHAENAIATLASFGQALCADAREATAGPGDEDLIDTGLLSDLADVTFRAGVIAALLDIADAIRGAGGAP